MYWLMKSEPDVYGIDDLARDGRTGWEGVRSFQARNIMRDLMSIGDRELFYHSSAKPPGVAGLARVCGPARPDPSQFDRKGRYFDPTSPPDNPRWLMVDVEFVSRFARLVPLDELKQVPGLENIMVIRRGARLSVQPVTPEEYAIIVKLGRRKRPARQRTA